MPAWAGDKSFLCFHFWRVWAGTGGSHRLGAIRTCASGRFPRTQAGLERGVYAASKSARLQEYQAGKNPVLIRIETRAGHGAGKPTSKLIEEKTDELGFLTRELGLRN
jgi:hypothetical protein